MSALSIIFICIFVATAIITLASLPGWIKIPDSYRKALFTALLLEVVGCVVMMVKNEQTSKEPALSHNNFVAINTKGQMDSVYLNEKRVGMEAVDFGKEARKHASYELQKEQSKFVVKNESLCLGCISDESLQQLGLFNDIDSQSSAFEYVRFTKSASGKWTSNKTFPLLSLVLEVDDSGYHIFNDTKTVKYAAGNSFNKSDRELHFFRSAKEKDKNNYLVRMIEANANPESQSPFATFCIIRFKPSIEK